MRVLIFFSWFLGTNMEQSNSEYSSVDKKTSLVDKLETGSFIHKCVNRVIREFGDGLILLNFCDSSAQEIISSKNLRLLLSCRDLCTCNKDENMAGMKLSG